MQSNYSWNDMLWATEVISVVDLNSFQNVMAVQRSELVIFSRRYSSNILSAT